MPRNPIYLNGRDAQNMGVNSPSAPAEPHKSYIQQNNDFNLTYRQGATLRYADVHPFFILEGLPADRIPLESFHSLRSYTLQAPLESDVYLHKSLTMVPMKAILPNAWDRFIVNPTKGDDVPEDVYCNLDIFKILLKALDARNMSPTNNNTLAQDVVKLVFMLETVFSRGSLLANLKIDFSSMWSSMKLGDSFDNWFDTVFIPWLKTTTINVERSLGNGDVQRLNLGVSPMVGTTTDIHTLVECLRDGCSFGFSGSSTTVPDEIISVLNSLASSLPTDYKPVDISRALAYQLSCVTVMSDDSIDNIFTDALFRNLIYDYCSPDFFEYNGEPIQYDSFSQHILEQIINKTSNSSRFVLSQYYEIFTLLFSFRRSLKFGDYFIDARPKPYSVGEMSAEVRDGMVSAIDTTVSILRQRFLNWSNRVGNKLYDYIKSLTGVSPSPSNSETKFIVHEQYPVRGFEVENTGSEQRDDLSVTTLLKTSQSKYLYDIELTDYCILLGLCHFDCERFYLGHIDHQAFKSTRFDFFNKFFQYSGDQQISRFELSSGHSNPFDPMAYTTRHMQYKTSVSHATGGFATGALPGWINTSDYNDSSQSTLSEGGINSEFIRNHSVDFDKFYSSLTAVSLGNYFHFIMNFQNILHVSRQMAVAPDIL